GKVFRRATGRGWIHRSAATTSSPTGDILNDADVPQRVNLVVGSLSIGVIAVDLRSVEGQRVFDPLVMAPHALGARCEFPRLLPLASRRLAVANRERSRLAFLFDERGIG